MASGQAWKPLQHLGLRHRAAARGAAGGAQPEPSLSRLRAPGGQELRRLRRGPAAQGLLQRGAGRLRQHRAAQALHHRRHGSEPGQAFQHERGAHPGEDSRRADREGRHHHRASVLSSGADVAPGRARLPPDAPHAAAQPPRGGRRGVHAGRQLAAARVLCARRQEQERVRARGGACRAQRRRPDRRGHAGQDGAVRTGCGGVPGARLHRTLREPEGRHDALRRDGGRVRGGHRRWRGGAAVRAAASTSPPRPPARPPCIASSRGSTRCGACRWASST